MRSWAVLRDDAVFLLVSWFPYANAGHLRPMHLGTTGVNVLLVDVIVYYKNVYRNIS